MQAAAQVIEDYIRGQIVLLPLYIAYTALIISKAGIKIQWRFHFLILSLSFLLPVTFYTWRALHPVAIIVFPGITIAGNANAVLMSPVSYSFYSFFLTLGIFGILALAGLITRQFYMEHKIKSTCSRNRRFKHVELFFSSVVNAPFTTGIINKNLYFPERLLKHKHALGLIVAHEFNHIRNHHLRYSLVEKVHQCIGWFNPLSHLLAKQGGKIRELLCDQATISRHDPVAYSQVLVAEAEMFSFTGRYVLADMFTHKGSFLKRRITMLLNNTTPKNKWGVAAILAISVLLSLGTWSLIGCGNFTDEEQSNKKITPPATAAKSPSESGRNMASIQSVVMQNLWEVKAAYDEILVNSTTLEGKIVAEFYIKPSGEVNKVRVVSSNMKAPELESSLVAIVEQWKFPEMRTADVTKVVYPFIFAPKK